MTGPSVSRLFADVVGQPQATSALQAAIFAPVHAYLFVGPAGSGRRRAAMAFAAGLLCPNDACGQCDVCDRARSGAHPDVVVVERSGATISMAQAREIRRIALRTPNEAKRKVLVLTEFQGAQEAGPALLKVIEEPPPSTVFVILVNHLPPELVTVASRCVRVDFGPIPPGVIAATLVSEGTEPSMADAVAAAAGGRLDRARLLAGDGTLAARAQVWKSVPFRLDGTGATVCLIVAELVELLSHAAVEPLESRHRAELEALVEPASSGGRVRKRTLGVTKDVIDRHKRDLRRLRTDELRFGLATVAATYRDAIKLRTAERRYCVEALDAIQAAAHALVRNPSESLLLQALLVRLLPLRPRYRE